MQHSKIISGIDIGTSKVTTIIGQYFSTEDKFNIVAASSIPATGFRKGQIINLEEASLTISQSIESAERMAGFQIDNASISLTAPHIESINSKGVVGISNPSGEITQTDIDRVIEAAKAITLPAGKEIIHVIPRVFTVDGQEGVIDPIGMNGVRLEVETHIILASSPSLKNLRKCLLDLGIRINSLVYSGLAAAKVALTSTEKELGIALIDIGGSNTTITIFVEGSPCYSAVIPIGGNNVTNDLAIGMRFSLDNAEKIKLKLAKLVDNKKFDDEIDLAQFGIIDDKKKISLSTAINGIIKPRLEEIFTLVYNQIQSSGYEHLIPAGIVLTGGGCQTVNTLDICSKVIPLPLRIAEPPKVGGIIDDILSPAYTSAVGLLTCSLEDNKKGEFTSPSKKNKVNLNSFFGRIKNLLEPLLP